MQAVCLTVTLEAATLFLIVELAVSSSLEPVKAESALAVFSFWQNIAGIKKGRQAV
jgi:hypothetical protein